MPLGNDQRYLIVAAYIDKIILGLVCRRKTAKLEAAKVLISFLYLVLIYIFSKIKKKANASTITIGQIYA